MKWNNTSHSNLLTKFLKESMCSEQRQQTAVAACLRCLTPVLVQDNKINPGRNMGQMTQLIILNWPMYTTETNAIDTWKSF